MTTGFTQAQEAELQERNEKVRIILTEIIRRNEDEIDDLLDDDVLPVTGKDRESLEALTGAIRRGGIPGVLPMDLVNRIDAIMWRLQEGRG